MVTADHFLFLTVIKYMATAYITSFVLHVLELLQTAAKRVAWSSYFRRQEFGTRLWNLPVAMIDKTLYRILTGTSGKFTFYPGPGPGWTFGPPSTLEDIGIYVHIPFCRSLCSFCPYTKAEFESSLASKYQAALQKETDILVRHLEGKAVSSIYFGGGTPMTLPGAIQNVVSKLSPYLKQEADIGIELHPEDVTQGNINTLKSISPDIILSLGIESLDDRTLEYLGRGYTAKDARQKLDMLLDADFTGINVDLMTCIPGQGIHHVLRDLSCLFDAGVAQVSAYPLMDFSYTDKRTNLSVLGQRRLLRSMARLGREKGYERSSVWTWTKPGKKQYSSITREQFLGLGTGSATNMGDYFSLNTFDTPSYIGSLSEGASPVALHTVFTPQEKALYWLFWRFYEGKVDTTSPNFCELGRLKPFIKLATKLGLVEGDRTLYLKEDSLFLYHLLERYYTRTYIGKLWAECRNRAFPGEITL